MAHLTSCTLLKPRIMRRVPLLTSNSPTSSAGESPEPMSRMTGSMELSPAARSASSYCSASSGRANCARPRKFLRQNPIGEAALDAAIGAFGHARQSPCLG